LIDITAPDLLAVLRRIEARGRYETANRTHGTFGSIFRYAIATGKRRCSFLLKAAVLRRQSALISYWRSSGAAARKG
jgi:hypothetical protein